MPATAYLAPPQPISLRSLLDSGSLNQSTVDAEWETFHNHVDAFLNAMDRYTTTAKTAIAEFATDHNAAVRDVTAEKEETERRIQQERQREADMLAALEHERITVADLSASVNHLQTSLAKVREQSAQVEGELNVVRKEVAAVRSEKARQGTALEDMRRRDTIELEILEETLGWIIDGVGHDKLLMRFTLLDPADPEREFSIVMDISKSDFSVPNCSPPLPDLGELVSQLNADRDLSLFIKRLRKSFKALVPAPQPPPSKFDNMSGPGLRTPASKNVPSPQDQRIDEATLDALRLK